MTDQFAHDLLTRSVARTCVALGYKETTKQNVDCLADVVAQFIQTMAQKSVESAEHSGRVAPGIQEILMTSLGKYSWKELRNFAFQDLGTSLDSRQSGSSQRDDSISLASSSGLRSGRSEPTPKWKQPFLFDVPNFPIKAPPRRSARFNPKDVDKSKPSSQKAADDIMAAKRRRLGVPSHCIPFPPDHAFSKAAMLAIGGVNVSDNAPPSKTADGGDDIVTRKRKIQTVTANQASLARIEANVPL